MLPKVARVLNPNDVHLVIGVVIPQVRHYVQLDLRLVLKLLLVPDDFDGNKLASLVILALDGLTEAAFPQKIQHFEPKR